MRLSSAQEYVDNQGQCVVSARDPLGAAHTALGTDHHAVAWRTEHECFAAPQHDLAGNGGAGNCHDGAPAQVWDGSQATRAAPFVTDTRHQFLYRNRQPSRHLLWWIFP